MSARMSRASTRSPEAGARPTRRVVGTAVALGALSASLVVGATGTAAAAPSNVSGVTFAWGVSGEQGGGAFAGGCNFLSAGSAGNAGSSHVWTEDEGRYRTSVGNVTVEKPDAEGVYAEPTFATKCQGPNGLPLSPVSTTSLSGNRVVFANGKGTVNTANDTARIAWNGAFTSVFYGGLTYWVAANPVLDVANGVGTVTANLSGYVATRTQPSTWTRIAPRPVVIATLTGVTLTDTGFSMLPDYLGVSVTPPAGGSAQSAPTTDNAAYWGSFPQSFVDFQGLTGQTSFWYSSGASRDPAKPALPISVSYTLPTPAVPTITSQPTSVTTVAGQTATFTVAASGNPTPRVTWQVREQGGAWTTVAGATGSTLSFETDRSMNRNAYRAVVTNSAGFVRSSAASLLVSNPPA